MLLLAPSSSYHRLPEARLHVTYLRELMHATPPPKKRARPAPGPPVEVWVWRVTPKETGRGEHRKLLDNLRPQGWQHFWDQRDPGRGRYRVEFRDARRSIVRVEYYNKLSRRRGGHVIRTQGRCRPSKRAVSLPVDAWDPDAPRATRADAPGAAPTQVHVPAAPRPRHPPLTPPGTAPEGTCWRLRKSGKWDTFELNRVPIAKNYTFLQLPSGEYVLVYAPDRRWPGYELITLSSGILCLVPVAE